MRLHRARRRNGLRSLRTEIDFRIRNDLYGTEGPFADGAARSAGLTDFLIFLLLTVGTGVYFTAWFGRAGLAPFP